MGGNPTSGWAWCVCDGPMGVCPLRVRCSWTDGGPLFEPVHSSHACLRDGCDGAARDAYLRPAWSRDDRCSRDPKCHIKKFTARVARLDMRAPHTVGARTGCVI